MTLKNLGSCIEKDLKELRFTHSLLRATWMGHLMFVRSFICSISWISDSVLFIVALFLTKFSFCNRYVYFMGVWPLQQMVT